MLIDDVTWVLRDGNDWDIFLNYSFAVFFIFYFVIGVFLNPLIVAYHARQKKTFTNFLFVLVSCMEQFKSVYFPIMLIPNLVSSPSNEDDYYFTNKLDSVSWTAYSNCFVFILVWFQMDALVILSASRYFTIAHPLSSSHKRHIVFSFVLLVSLLKYLYIPFSLTFLQNDVVYSRIYGSITSTNYIGPLFFLLSGSLFLFDVVGAIFVFLTIRHLKNSDTASSGSSDRNIRRGTYYLIATSFLNVFLLSSNAGLNVLLCLMRASDWTLCSTGLDFFQFITSREIPLIQGIFNSLSFLFICSLFRGFIKRFLKKISDYFITESNV